MHSMLKANAPSLTHFNVRNDLSRCVGKDESGRHGLYTFNVSETRSERAGGGSEDNFERSTGL